MNYQCPFCGGEFWADNGVESVMCPHCNEEVQLVPTEEPLVPEEVPQQPQRPVGVFEVGPSGKSRGVAGLLAIFLGMCGAHYFYLGKTKPAVINIVASLLCLLMPVVKIADLIIGIRMLMATQEEFEERYVYNDSIYPF